MSAFEILSRSMCEGMAIVCLVILFYLVCFKWFFYYVVHIVGLPPSLSPWFVIVHLCSTFGFYGDSLSLLCPWCGKDNFPCCVECFCIYHEVCGISCFMRVDLHSSIACPWVFMFTSQYFGFGEWCLEIG